MATVRSERGDAAEATWVPGPAGRLEAVLERPEEGPVRAAAAVAHPHPLHGGTMRNTVVYRVARALRAAGVATLRFNFRGVEASEGEHDGRPGPGGEEDDVAACLGALAERFPGAPLWAAGYSFGARAVGGLAVRDGRIERAVLVAPPVKLLDCAFLDRLRLPSLVVTAGADRFGTLADLEARHPDLDDAVERVEVDGADHLFRGRTPALEERVRAWARAATGADR